MQTTVSKFNTMSCPKLSFFFFFRHLFHFLSDEEKKVVKSLGYKVLCDLQAGMISSSSVLVASIMLQNLQGLRFGMLVCQ